MSCQNGDDFPFKSKSPEPTEFCECGTLHSLGTGLNLVRCSNLLFVPCSKRGAFHFYRSYILFLVDQVVGRVTCAECVHRV